MKSKALLLALVLVLCVTSASAQLFLPTLVYDPTNYGNAILRYSQLQAMNSWQIQTFWQAVYTVQALQQEYAHLLFMAQQMADKDRYRAVLTPWRRSEAANRYGTTGAVDDGHQPGRRSPDRLQTGH